MTNIPIEIQLVTRISGIRNLYSITVEDKSLIQLKQYMGRNEVANFEIDRELSQDEISLLISMLSEMKIPLVIPQIIDEIDFHADNYQLKLETELINFSILWDEGEDQKSYLHLNEIRDFIIRLIKPQEEKYLNDDALVSRVKPKNSVMDWDLTIEQKEKFLDLMNSMGTHSTFYMSAMVKRLNSCGIPAHEDLDNNCMVLGDEKISLTTPEWGEPGIYPPSVLSVVIKHYGYKITTNMTGKGFAHNDTLQKLAKLWGLKKDYL